MRVWSEVAATLTTTATSTGDAKLQPHPQRHSQSSEWVLIRSAQMQTGEWWRKQSHTQRQVVPDMGTGDRFRKFLPQSDRPGGRCHPAKGWCFLSRPLGNVGRKEDRFLLCTRNTL